MTGTFPGMSGQSPPMRLVIVDDHQMVLDGLKAMLRPYAAQVEVAGEASDPGDAVSVVARLQPDAVLLDVRLRGASGLDLCSDILAAHPACKVVFLTVYDDEQYLSQALRVGAERFLLKRIRGGGLVECLRRIGRRQGPHRPGARRAGGAVGGPAAPRGDLAGRAPGPGPAGE